MIRSLFHIYLSTMLLVSVFALQAQEETPGSVDTSNEQKEDNKEAVSIQNAAKADQERENGTVNPGALELHNAADYSRKMRIILFEKRDKLASIQKRLGSEAESIEGFNNQYKDFAETLAKADSDYYRKKWIESRDGMKSALEKSRIAEKTLADSLFQSANKRLETASTLLASCESAMVLKPEDACGSTRLLAKSRHQLANAYSEMEEAKRLADSKNFTLAIDSILLAGVRARSITKQLQDGGW